jgi:hypothetical protein
LGLLILLSDPSLATLPVSATFKGLPPHEEIGKILAGFSYVLYPSAETGKLEVHVLATPEGAAAESGFTSQGGTHGPDNASLPPASIDGMSPSLGEVQAVEMELYQFA